MEPHEKMIKAQDVLSEMLTSFDVSIENRESNGYSLIFFHERTGKDHRADFASAQIRNMSAEDIIALAAYYTGVWAARKGIE